MIDHYCGILQFSERDLEDWQRLLERRRQWLAVRGIQYLLVVAPDKQSLYPDKLPVWLLRATPPHRQTKLDQFVAYMKTHSTMPIIDLRPALMEAKQHAPVFQMTDIHWNEYGAFIGYDAIIHALAKQQVPGMTPVPLDAYFATNHPSENTDQAGNPRWDSDLADMLGVKMAESNAVYMVPGPTLAGCQTFLPGGEHIREMAFVKTPQLQSRAMIYQDSFARFWLPFMGNHFGETDFFWQYQFDAQEITRQKPAVVISEFLESKFNITDPNQLSKLEALP